MPHPDHHDFAHRQREAAFLHPGHHDPFGMDRAKAELRNLKDPVTAELLRGLIEEIRGLRADLARQRWLPDTPEVRAIRARLDDKS